MKFLKKTRFYIIAIILAIVGLLLVFNELLTIGLILLGLGFLFVMMWELFLKEKERVIDTLINENEKLIGKNVSLEKDINDLSSRKLNISQINTILDLGLLEVDTNFKRTINKDLQIMSKEARFFGVLSVDIKAKFGIDIRKLKFKIDESKKTIYIAEAIPEFLSFSKRSFTWEIAEVLENHSPVVGSPFWRTNPKLDKHKNEMMDSIRVKTESETETGPEELLWIIEPLKKQVLTALEFILGLNNYKVQLVEFGNDSFLPLSDYNKTYISEEGNTTEKK